MTGGCEQGENQLFVAATCPKIDMLLQQIADFYLLAQ